MGFSPYRTNWQKPVKTVFIYGFYFWPKFFTKFVQKYYIKIKIKMFIPARRKPPRENLLYRNEIAIFRVSINFVKMHTVAKNRRNKKCRRHGLMNLKPRLRLRKTGFYSPRIKQYCQQDQTKVYFLSTGNIFNLCLKLTSKKCLIC